MNRRTNRLGRTLCAALGLGLALGSASCDGVTEPEILTLFVGPQRVECVGEAEQLCLQVKEDPEADWQLFYDEIEGFEFEPGFLYELRVRRHTVEDPPADASSFCWELLEVVSKTPV